MEFTKTGQHPNYLSDLRWPKDEYFSVLVMNEVMWDSLRGLEITNMLGEIAWIGDKWNETA